MTKKKERFGCLSESMIKFLRINDEEKRAATYGKNGASKMYERIRKNVQGSFVDAKTAFEYLPKKQRNKIDLVTSFNDLLEYVTHHKRAKDLPDVPIRTAIKQLETITQNFADKNLKDFAMPEFSRFIDLLQYIESKSPSHEQDSTSTKPSTSFP